MKKIIKILFIILAIIFSVSAIGGITYYHTITNGISLDTQKLEKSKTETMIKVFDENYDEIKPSSQSFISLSKLSSNTKNAFITAEDKRFYKHKGLDLIRIGGAILSNLKSRSFSEGASTISQQLVKNTQLSNEKTINRKLKEIKLTKQLENKYSKNEILELYLNNIYFGNGCYGIENASKHYFGKSATELTLAESALLASTINAPSIYDIENKTENATKRRNLILKLMKDQNKISKDEYNQAINEKVNLKISEISSNSTLYNQVISEAQKILKTNENHLRNSNYKIYTYIDSGLNKTINKIINSFNIETNPNIINMVLDNKTHGIVSINGKQNLINSKYQPGSTIKPILVFAPAIENNLISPSTKILDNKININGYSPENADKQYHGFVSAKTALANSYNIPAVKLLNELGISKAKNFAKNLGITFSNNDNHLALALGGFSEGLTPKQLIDAYSSFANQGKFQISSLIKKITLNGKTIYENIIKEKQVMKDSTAYLINNMLCETSKTGTAKRLKNFDYQIASKTGTVGKNKSKKNICAYNISYTTNHTILTLISGNDLPENVNGATYPTMITKDIIESLYLAETPQNFTIPITVSKLKFDKNNYDTLNEIKETDENNFIEDYFSNANLPQNIQTNFKLKAINIEGKKPILCFTLNKNYDYFLIRRHKKTEEIIYSSVSKNDNNNTKFIDNSAKIGQIYEYKLKICEKNSNEEFFSNIVKLKTN